MGSSAANWSRAPAASPACPVQRARLARAARVSGCSWPRTRSIMGNRPRTGRGPGRMPRLPRPPGEVGAGCQGVGVLRAADPLDDGQQAANWSRAPAASPPARSSGRARRGWPGCWGARGRDPLLHGQQRGELVAGRGRVARLAGPAGEVGAGDQGVGVLGAADPFAAGSRAANWSRAAAGSPPPRSSGRGCRGSVRVSGCSGPRTRSRMGSRAAYWSRAPAASPACPVQ